jgi:hypothetical protein
VREAGAKAEALATSEARMARYCILEVLAWREGECASRGYLQGCFEMWHFVMFSAYIFHERFGGCRLSSQLASRIASKLETTRTRKGIAVLALAASRIACSSLRPARCTFLFSRNCIASAARNNSSKQGFCSYISIAHLQLDISGNARYPQSQQHRTSSSKQQLNKSKYSIPSSIISYGLLR